jgi:shikimate kinase
MNFPPNIVLIGFMGAGKSSTGKELAEILKFEFLDIDQWIEEKNKKRIPDIFEENGEAFFRDQEREAVKCVMSKKRAVISAGGGLWLDEKNRSLLKKMGWCVWLKVSPEVAWQRVGAFLDHRPLLSQSKDPLSAIKKILIERDSVYALAHANFDSDGKSPKEVSREILSFLKEKNILNLD